MAGRPKGSKDSTPRRTVGRKLAELAAHPRKTVEVTAKAGASIGGVMPLAFMLKRMRNAKVPMEERLRLAQACAPYLHPKLASVQHRTPDEGDGSFTVQIKRL